MTTHLKNNQIPETRYLNSNNTPLNRPATNGAFLCKLLTSGSIRVWLTKVNKMKHTVLNTNNLEHIQINRKTVQKPHYLTKNHLFISFFYSLLLA